MDKEDLLKYEILVQEIICMLLQSLTPFHVSEFFIKTFSGCATVYSYMPSPKIKKKQLALHLKHIRFINYLSSYNHA